MEKGAKGRQSFSSRCDALLMPKYLPSSLSLFVIISQCVLFVQGPLFLALVSLKTSDKLQHTQLLSPHTIAPAADRVLLTW